MYLSTQIPKERADRFWSAVKQIKREEMFEIAKKRSVENAVFIRISTTKEGPAETIPGFTNQTTLGHSSYLDFLLKRDAAPYSGWYELHVIYY